jgi:hypothetical protein
MLWALSLAAGIALAALTYGVRGPRPVSALRALAGTLAFALLLNAPLAPARPLAPWIALDASASWMLQDSAQWRAARVSVDSARAAGADSIVLFGARLRGESIPAQPTDSATAVTELVEVARALGRPVTVVTDGRIADAERLVDLPTGSAIVLHEGTPAPDLAVASFDSPRAAVIGDTIELDAVVRAGSAGASPRSIMVRLGDRPLGETALAELPAYGERAVRWRVPVPAVEGAQALTVSLDAGDAVRANDLAVASLLVSGTATIAFVSTSPDQDARLALAVLRGTQRGAVRAYQRVAPGQWREGDALRAVPEDAVRRAVEQASLVVLHGDTAYFGAPRRRARGALVLMPPGEGNEEFYVTGAGASPLRAALGDLPFDALPPLRVGAPMTGSSLPALLARRARRGDDRAVVALQEGPPRVAVVAAAGFWRWRTRGGRTAEAFDALWGSIFDWVTTTTRPDGAVAESPRIATELVPGPARVRAGPVGTGPVRDLAPRAREAWWLAVLALLALCGEWVMRRRIGWR